jgi:EAL domain-containing protein (putative c-di-GMP-specific phosphodiesterase class I)
MLITGTPSLESATRAIEHGVFRYLHKPFDAAQLVSLVRQASRLHGLAKLKREALELGGAPSVVGDVGPDLDFQLALDQLWLAFQPIISIRERGVYGYEALMRSSAPTFRSPSDLLEAAERLNALNRLGRAVRRHAASGLRDAANDTLLFVNLHPQDLFDPELTAPNSPLVAIAHRVVLEVTERASLDGTRDLKARLEAVRALGFRVAVDDLGAGYAGLNSFVLLEPDIVKLDMSLTRGIDQSPVKKKLIGSVSTMCREMGIAVVVEGVETMAELDTLLALNCDLFQGFLFAPPARSLAPMTW